MDRRRTLTELEPEELIERLNAANCKLNERCTMYKMAIERKNKVMDIIWKRNAKHETDNQILQDTIDILQKTIDSMAVQLSAAQLARELNDKILRTCLGETNHALIRLYSDMESRDFEQYDAHDEIERLSHEISATLEKSQ